MDQKTKNKLKRKIRQFKKINFVRRIVQLVCFLLLPGFFIQIYSSTKALVVALLAGSFSLQANSIDLVVVLSVYPLTLLFGRFFCGWICAMGSLGDLLTSIRNGLKIKEHQIGESADTKLKLVKYMLLLFSIIFIWVLQIVAIPQGYHPNVGCPKSGIRYVYCMVSLEAEDRNFMDLRTQRIFGERLE